MKAYSYDVCIVGGCGHVGLPLGLAFANAGLKVVLYDLSERNVGSVLDKKMPFKEDGAQPMLESTIDSGNLFATTDAAVVARSEAVVMVIGTPVDEHLNPKYHEVMRAVEDIQEYMDDQQLLVMRSTLFPGTTDWIARKLGDQGIDVDVAFCPERIAEGHALTELYSLPQIVSGTSKKAVERASRLFGNLTNRIIELTTEEAETAKLMTNTWRYLSFAVSNQFYMIAAEKGLDFHRMQSAMKQDYPRLQSFAGPGFAAGPCLFKDNQQLWSYAGTTFVMGDAAMRVNEDLPAFLVDQLKKNLARDGRQLSRLTSSILGMAFKGNSDDARESLSYKLRKLLLKEAGQVYCADPFVSDDRLVPQDFAIAEADIVFIGTPHRQYKDLDLSGKVVVDIWNFVQEES